MEIFGNRVNQNKNILKYYVFSDKTKSIPMCDLSRKNDASAKMKKTIRSPIENGDLTNTTIYGGATDQPITTVIWDQQQGNLHQQQCGLKPGIGQNIVSKKAKKSPQSLIWLIWYGHGCPRHTVGLTKSHLGLVAPSGQAPGVPCVTPQLSSSKMLSGDVSIPLVPGTACCVQNVLWRKDAQGTLHTPFACKRQAQPWHYLWRLGSRNIL